MKSSPAAGFPSVLSLRRLHSGATPPVLLFLGLATDVPSTARERHSWVQMQLTFITDFILFPGPETATFPIHAGRGLHLTSLIGALAGLTLKHASSGPCSPRGPRHIPVPLRCPREPVTWINPVVPTTSTPWHLGKILLITA